MHTNGPGTGTDATAGLPGPSGLTPEHRAALSQAAGMINNGQSSEAAVDHLVSTGMPRMVAKVLVKQYDKRPTG